MLWNRNVVNRFKVQHEKSTHTFENHILRLGQMALATNPFECYLDYAPQIRARSRAVQTFVVQLAGSGNDHAVWANAMLFKVKQ